MQRPRTSFILDLDGTVGDGVCQHVLAWHEALETEGINLSIWRFHRKVGMSGGLFTNMLLRETGQEMSPERVERLLNLHSAEACRVRQWDRKVGCRRHSGERRRGHNPRQGARPGLDAKVEVVSALAATPINFRNGSA
jgi:hypothetical protein